MADIELVIKIDEEVYKKAKETHDVMCDSVWLGIKYGTQLPKGHGILIDADELAQEIIDDNQLRFFNSESEKIIHNKMVDFAVDRIADATAIIEADKESEVNE